jgi:hypothetical protein
MRLASSSLRMCGKVPHELPLLHRQILRGRNFGDLTLETDLVGAVIAAVGGTVPRGIVHIQIEKGKRLELGLYDNCALKASFFGPSLSPSFFANLQGDRIISQSTEH